MNKHEQNRFSESSKIKHPQQNFSFSLFFEQVHTINTFYLLAGLLQVFAGVSVIIVSVLGFISELWLSNLLTMLSSISTVAGAYLIYITLAKRRDSRALVNDAMKRVMEAKN